MMVYIVCFYNNKKQQKKPFPTHNIRFSGKNNVRKKYAGKEMKI